MNRSIQFSAFAFLLLLALLFLLSDQFSRLSAPRCMLESEKTIDRTAVEKATLINSHAVGPFPEPVEIRVLANFQAVNSSVDSAINQIMGKLRRVQPRLKDRVRQPFNVKIVPRHNPTANLVIRIRSWLVSSGSGIQGMDGRGNKIGYMDEDSKSRSRQQDSRLAGRN
jgi:hypothetical protein